jgi:hypothetical protein
VVKTSATVSAFVLITVPANRSGDVVRILMDSYRDFVTEQPLFTEKLTS